MTFAPERASGLPDAPPASLVLRLTPDFALPFVQLARLDRPTGWQLLLAPCWEATALAGVPVVAGAALVPMACSPVDDGGSGDPTSGHTRGSRAGALSERPVARASRSAPQPIRLTVEANGDLLIHSPIYFRARALARSGGYDFRPMLRRVGA